RGPLAGPPAPPHTHGRLEPRPRDALRRVDRGFVQPARLGQCRVVGVERLPADDVPLSHGGPPSVPVTRKARSRLGNRLHAPGVIGSLMTWPLPYRSGATGLRLPRPCSGDTLSSNPPDPGVRGTIDPVGDDIIFREHRLDPDKVDRCKPFDQSQSD